MPARSRLVSMLGGWANRLPAPIADRVLPWKRRAFADAGVARVSRNARVRLLIAPVNSAEQGFAWARASERLPQVAAASFMYRSGDDVFAFRADQSVSIAYFAENRRWQRAQRTAIRRGFTHLLVESGRQIVGVDESAEDQIGYYRRHGLSVALLWHGSDIRDPSMHAAREPDSPFAGAYPDTARLIEGARRNRALIEAIALPNFVSTPDLLVDVPIARWLPTVVEPSRWSGVAGTAPLQREIPVVCHAPSRAGLKGTAAVEAALSDLQAEGLIEYRQTTGLRSAEMPAFYGAADIVLDQFSLGSYGVAACEAMAAGRVVVGHVSDDVRAIVERETSRRLPIVEARASELDAVIRGLLADRSAAVEMAAESRDFVAAVHSGDFSADVLASFLGRL